MDTLKIHTSNIDVAVLLIFFNRPECLRKTFEEVKKARPSKLLLYQDGPRVDNLNDKEGIENCRTIVSDIDWECEVHTLFQDRNYGCDPSGYLARKWAFNMVNKCIILEDDCVPSQSFFLFCKDLLDRYENDTRINMICGMNNLESWESPYSYLFSDTGSIWGVATWKRVIDGWDGNYQLLDNPYSSSLIKRLFNKSISHDKDLYKYWRRHKEDGKAYHESIGSIYQLSNNMLNIVPTKNMISNVGNSSEGGTHAVEDIKMVPRGLRKLFSLKSFELEKPLVHPPYMIHDLKYTNKLHKLMGDGRPIIRYWRLLEKSMLILRYKGFRGLLNKIKTRKL